MSLASLKTDNSIEVEKDIIGGAVRIEETNVYNLTIELAFLKTSQSGALALETHFKTDTGANLRQTFWMCSGTAKGGKNFYMSKDGKKRYLPGFTLANDLALLTAASEIGDLNTDEKMVKLYDYVAKEEVPTKVQMFTDLVGTQVKAGIQMSIEDKNIKNDADQYVPSGETRTESNVDKFFRARDGLTRTEIIAGEAESVFVDAWIAKNQGSIRNNAKGANGVATGSPLSSASTQAAAANGPKPVTSLFS